MDKLDQVGVLCVILLCCIVTGTLYGTHAQGVSKRFTCEHLGAEYDKTLDKCVKREQVKGVLYESVD